MLIENLLPIGVDHRHSRDAHPTRRVNHLTIQCRNIECFTWLRSVWGTGVREGVSPVQIYRI